MEYLIPMLLVYFIPTGVTPPGRRGSVFLINLVVGWTLLGWVIALFMALRAREEAAAKKEA